MTEFKVTPMQDMLIMEYELTLREVVGLANGKPVAGKVAVVSDIPTCNFCEEPGPFDFATYMGAWANGCEAHWRQYGASRGLGVGRAQLWVTLDQVNAHA